MCVNGCMDWLLHNHHFVMNAMLLDYGDKDFVVADVSIVRIVAPITTHEVSDLVLDQVKEGEVKG